MVESLTSVQRQMLIADNIKLVYHVANKFMPCPKGYCYEVDDLISEGYIGLVVASRNYDPAKGSFSTYAYKVIESRIKRSLPKYRLAHISLDTPVVKDDEETTTVGEIIASGYSVEDEVIRHDIVTRLQNYLTVLTKDERDQLLRYIQTGKAMDTKLFKVARKKLLRAMKRDQFEADLDDLTVFISCPAVHIVSGNGYFSSPVETTVLAREEKRKQLEILSSIPQLDKLRLLKQQGEQDKIKLLTAKFEVEEFIERHIDKLSINHIRLLEDYFVWCYSHLAMVQKYGSGYKAQIKRAVQKLMG